MAPCHIAAGGATRSGSGEALKRERERDNGSPKGGETNEEGRSTAKKGRPTNVIMTSGLILGTSSKK